VAGAGRKAADHSLGEGDKELAGCAKTVRDTIAACTALRELAAADSPHAKDLAKVFSGICGDCEAECKKHEKHSVCKDCELEGDRYR
jgi:Cys-rich four helix bundle protein (predicted Tat secretion target)